MARTLSNLVTVGWRGQHEYHNQFAAHPRRPRKPSLKFRVGKNSSFWRGVRARTSGGIVKHRPLSQAANDFHGSLYDYFQNNC